MHDPEKVLTNQESFLPLEYGKTKLPEFSRSESALRDIRISTEELLRNSEFAAQVEFLKTFKGSRALRQIDTVVDAFIVRMLDTQGIPSGLRHRAKNAIERKEYAGVVTDSAEHFALRELVAKANRIKFALVTRWIETSPDTGLSEVAKIEYVSLAPGMAALDRLYLKLVTEPSAIDSNERTRQGFTENEDYVMRIVDGKVQEVPMHKAYPDEIAAVIASYQKLLAEFLKLAEKARAKGIPIDTESPLARKVRYYQAVLKAFQTSSTADWVKADELLPQQIADGSDVIHIHPIETGYLKDRHVRAPEMSLRAPDQEAARTQKLSIETKARMLRMMDDSRFADIRTMETSKALVEKSNAIARHSLGAGMDMDLKPAGQILPNRLSARLKGGVDASLDLSTVYERQPLTSEGFIRAFGQREFFEQYEPHIDPENYLGEFVASHEISHAIGLHPTMEERLGSDIVGPYVEEWKATVGGMVFNNYLPFLRGEIPIENLQAAVVNRLADAARYSANRDKDSAHGYYRQSIMIMKVAEESGVVEPSGNSEMPWKINLDPARVEEFFERLTQQYHEMLEIYAEGTRDDLKDFLTEHCRPTSFVDYMARAVDDPSSGKTMPTPADVAKLPA